MHSGLPTYSIFAPDVLMTDAHRARSLLIRLANSAGELPTKTVPEGSKRLRISGSDRMRRVSWYSLSTTAAGVFAGASKPYHKSDSKLVRPAVSAMAGTLGSDGERFLLATPITRTLPLSINGVAGNMLTNMNFTSPPISATSAGAAPLYGMFVISSLAVDFSNSPARCAPPPLPDEP